MSDLVREITEKDHVQGPSSAPITIVEYGDYQCPHCAHAYPVFKSLKKKLGEKLRFVFRNFPLTQAHPMAEFAAEAAEAAGAQGKFWEMHDAIFENQDRLDQQLILDLAKKLGLNEKKLREDLESRKYQSHVKQDFMGGVRSGVNGTPGVFINGERYGGSIDPEVLAKVMNEL